MGLNVGEGQGASLSGEPWQKQRANRVAAIAIPMLLGFRSHGLSSFIDAGTAEVKRSGFSLDSGDDSTVPSIPGRWQSHLTRQALRPQIPRLDESGAT